MEPRAPYSPTYLERALDDERAVELLRRAVAPGELVAIAREERRQIGHLGRGALHAAILGLLRRFSER